MPSGCNLRRVAHPPGNQLAVPDRTSVSDYQEEQETIDPADMHMAIAAPVFQPYRGATGRAWMAKEYGLSVDTSSLLSSGTERDDTDEEVFSFDLGPEPYDPSHLMSGLMTTNRDFNLGARSPNTTNTSSLK